jgi:hypothetical protein
MDAQLSSLLFSIYKSTLKKEDPKDQIKQIIQIVFDDETYSNLIDNIVDAISSEIHHIISHVDICPQNGIQFILLSYSLVKKFNSPHFEDIVKLSLEYITREDGRYSIQNTMTNKLVELTLYWYMKKILKKDEISNVKANTLKLKFTPFIRSILTRYLSILLSPDTVDANKAM